MLKKSILRQILAYLARETIRMYQPKIIGITGSVGKTSARDAIYAVLREQFRVRKSEKNYNNEIGFPLAILGIKHQGPSVLRWFRALLLAYFGTLFRNSSYPDILVLEYGVDHPGDMDYLLSIAKPAIAVVTAIGDVPVHVEFFASPEDVALEKAKLVLAVAPVGHVILNHDDYAVYDMKEKTKARVTTFGFEERAEVRISNLKLQLKKDEEFGDLPEGITFKIEYSGNLVPVRLQNTFGIPQAYAAGAAAAVGITLGMNLVEIADFLGEYVSPPGRMRLLRGIKKSYILDDTYNAAPEAMRSALDTLKNINGKRKIAVLGDMLEIGKYTEQAHRAIGDQVAGFADMLVTVGPRAKFIADEAKTRGIERDAHTLSAEQVISLDSAEEAGRALDPLIEEGDLILVKGSQALRMEKTVLEIMAWPDKASELLVRQEECWK